MSMRYLTRCQPGDIVSRLGQVFKIYSLSCLAPAPGRGTDHITVWAGTLCETDAWMSERYPRNYPNTVEVRFLGHED